MRRFSSPLFVASLTATFLLAVAPSLEAGKISLQSGDKQVKVLVDDKPFATYLTSSGSKPIIWPIVGPTSVEMTRAYPMQAVEGEKHDHPHQRSFWFTHGDVNGVDFWSEPISYKGKTPAGKVLGMINQREIVRQVATNDKAVIETINDWVDTTGKKHLEDTRRMTFRADGDARSIDFDITLKATAGDVKFGDTKEGAFGIRVPTVIDVDPDKSKPRAAGEGGHIVNSEGQTDKDAWGKAAKWVDYYGPINGQVVGIAVLNHPSSFRSPSHWHVRTYGLFAANPFGLHDFTGKKEIDGSHTIRSGESIHLRYRVIFHSGDAKAANLEAAFAKYAAEE